jgi:very-short-patch-repair endonuclease
MTRCYEFYCVVLNNPSFCAEKSDRAVAYINKYIKIMQDKGVKFDKSPEDKALFESLQKEVGSEFAVTQPQPEESLDTFDAKRKFLQSSESIPQPETPSEHGLDSEPAYKEPRNEIQTEDIPLITETPHQKQNVESCSVCQTAPPQAFQTATPLPCSSCHVNTYFSRTKRNGAVICSLCLEREWKKGTLKESDLLSKDETPVEAPKPESKPQVKEWKPTDKWEHRAAQMQPQHSRIEESLLLKLQETGLHPITDKEFCIQSTTPDFYFPDKNLAVYIDGKVHEGKEERDQTIRELLTKRFGVKVVSISYENFTQEETERVLKEIQSLL